MLPEGDNSWKMLIFTYTWLRVIKSVKEFEAEELIWIKAQTEENMECVLGIASFPT